MLGNVEVLDGRFKGSKPCSHILCFSNSGVGSTHRETLWFSIECEWAMGNIPSQPDGVVVATSPMSAHTSSFYGNTPGSGCDRIFSTFIFITTCFTNSPWDPLTRLGEMVSCQSLMTLIEALRFGLVSNIVVKVGISSC